MSSFFILASSHKSGKYSGLSTPTLILFKKILKLKIFVENFAIPATKPRIKAQTNLQT